MIKYIFFDVSGTLMSKPSVFTNIIETLAKHGITISLQELKWKHKLLSEVILFPDRTDKYFYNKFNTELLRILGVLPTTELVNDIFESCTYLPWEIFEDTAALSEISLPKGIISNFDTSLKKKLNGYFGDIFEHVFGSEEFGISKPAITFYEAVLKKVGLPAGEILYVGDSIKLDIEPASKLGMKCLLIDRDSAFLNSSMRIDSLHDIKHYLD